MFAVHCTQLASIRHTLVSQCVKAYIMDTGSSAVAERPRDDSRLFVSRLQYIDLNLVLLVTSASDLPLRTKLCYAVFGVVVHAGCDKQDSLMRGGLRGKQTSR